MTSNLSQFSSSISDNVLLYHYANDQLNIKNRLKAQQHKFSKSNALKALDQSVEIACHNNPIKGSRKFKYVINSRLSQGSNPYQYIGNKVHLKSLKLQIYSNAQIDSQNPQYERRIRVTVVYFNQFNGATEKPPSFSAFFSAPSIIEGRNLSCFFSEPNPSFLDNSVLIYDYILPLGCLLENPLIIRSNGNLFLDKEFNLVNFETVFYPEPAIGTDQPDLMYQNISGGLLVLYVQADFMNLPQSSNDSVIVSSQMRLEFVDG